MRRAAAVLAMSVALVTGCGHAPVPHRYERLSARCQVQYGGRAGHLHWAKVCE